MALSLDPGELNARIDTLRVGFAGHRDRVLRRNQVYLRAYSPKFDTNLGEHDQWPEPLKQEEQDHYRSSYNVTAAVVDIWSALEMSELPAIRWQEAYIPVPAPSLDEATAEARQEIHRAERHVARTVATMREQALMRHVRRSNLGDHAYRGVRRKNVYGHSWVKTVPDREARSFRVYSNIDPSTVYPVYSAFDDERLDAVLVATRRSIQSVRSQFPNLRLPMHSNGLHLDRDSSYYQPTQEALTDADRAFIWVEDYWCVDSEWRGEAADGAEPVESRVLNVIRANHEIALIVEYPGWTRVPYYRFINENERDDLGSSDVGLMLPFQDSLNKFLSQQQDVIAGESRPKFKYRGDSQRTITFNDEGVVSLEPDEDIEQIAVRLDVFPTQIHGQQIAELMARATGLPDTVWGRITASQNSGRALSTAWRATSTRLVPRTRSNTRTLKGVFSQWCDWLELYGWDSARDLFNGNRDFDLDFPNQEPRDFTEITADAINRLQAGGIDLPRFMELTGERSPDEMLERVRAEYMDAVLHPEKAQSYILLTRLKNQVAIEAAQAEQQAAMVEAQLAAQQQQPPGGAPGPGSVEQQAGAARQARTQANQERAPQLREDQNAPATQAGQEGNSTKFGTLVQDGQTFNRIIDQGEI